MQRLRKQAADLTSRAIKHRNSNYFAFIVRSNDATLQRCKPPLDIVIAELTEAECTLYKRHLHTWLAYKSPAWYARYKSRNAS